MTVICYRDGVLAADTMISASGVIVGRAVKLIQGKAGYAGACGPAGTAGRFEWWFKELVKGGEDINFLKFDPRDDGHQFGALIVMNDKTVIIMDNVGDIFRPQADYHAIGGAYEMAIGAMASGASAVRAVEICIENHIYCGGGITVIDIGKGFRK